MAKQATDMESIIFTLLDIRDALVDIATQLEEINKKLGNFEECIDTRTQLKVLRVADMTRKQ
jgi:hypothetical protein